ncbi:kinase-like protein [Agrocybe pediades]|nr:kinase-like protein [Agrocybe pediades]
MRYLSPSLSFSLVVFCLFYVVLAQAPKVVTSPFVMIPGRPYSAHASGVQAANKNGTSVVVRPSSRTQTIYLRPRGSRTKGCNLPASKTLPGLSSSVGIKPALQSLGYLLAATLSSLVFLFSSLDGLWRVLVHTADQWECLRSDITKTASELAFCVAVFVLSTLWACFLVSRDGLLLATRHTSLFLQQTSLFLQESHLNVKLWFERRRIRQWEREVAQCIRRKLPKKPTPNPRQQVVRHRGIPLFRWTPVEFHRLPEEEAEKAEPTRHMYDPVYFNMVKKLGEGAFGVIYLVQHRISGKLMAMKTLLRRNNKREDVDLEIRAMIRTQGLPWFPELRSTFIDEDQFYILMPYYCRGDLYVYMESLGGCLHRELAKFYLAELFLAIQSLHKMGIVHRDLKPNNLLFGEDRHLVVADFGVAAVFTPEENEEAFLEDEFPLWVESRERDGDDFPFLTPSIDNPHIMMGLYGTSLYAAPEVVEGGDYSYGVDYYSMAVLYHEMVTGYVPTRYGPTRPGTEGDVIILDLDRKDVHLQCMSSTDMHFMEKMLDRDPFARPNVRQMRAHPVFAGIDWEKLSRREVPIPSPVTLRKRVASSLALYPVPTDEYGQF